MLKYPILDYESFVHTESREKTSLLAFKISTLILFKLFELNPNEKLLIL